MATRGAGRVSPNPMVGCLIVRDGTVLASGWHHRFGLPHAEADALARLNGKARGATLYVNLEPCNHIGKTPPCTEAIIASGVSHVVIAMKDPNAHVRGGGIRRLRAAGIDVTLGVCEQEARELNRAFLHWIRTATPYVTVKLAQSLDAKIAAHEGTRTQISGEASQKYVHKLRAEYDAVLIGAGTMRTDHPLLTVRHVRGRNPVRVIVDTTLRAGYRDTFLSADASTIIYTSKATLKNPKVIALLKRGAGIVAAPLRGSRIDLDFVLRDLGGRGIASVLVEGGREIATEFLAQRRANELQLIVAPLFLGDGVEALGPAALKAGSPSSLTTRSLGSDILITARFSQN